MLIMLATSAEILGAYISLQWQEDARQGARPIEAVSYLHRVNKCVLISSRLSDKEPDMRDKLMPSVTYLQRLGPEYLDLIFEHSRWVFEHDVDIGFEVRA